MAIECYNRDCEFHFKEEPFCFEEECRKVRDLYQECANIAADNKVILVLMKETVQKNICIVLCDRGHEYVTWVANLHIGCEGFCDGHYYRYDICGGKEEALTEALADFKKRN